MDLCRQYIPTVSLTGIVYQYIPTELETELFLSVKITDKKISSVIPLVFTDFLGVTYMDPIPSNVFFFW